MAYNELVQRGTGDFPFDLYLIDENHPKYFMSAHWHQEPEIIRVLKGKFHVKLNSRTYTAKKGDIIFVNPETVHQGVPESCEYECIVFHIDSLYTALSGCNFFIESIFNRDYLVNEYNPSCDNLFKKSVDEMFDAMKTRSPGYKFRVVSAFYNFLATVSGDGLYTLSGTSESVSDDKNLLKLKKVLSFMRENYQKPITLSDMAKTVDMSPKYLGVFIKNMTGKTPFEYLNEYRIERASRKLLNSDKNITEIAYACGFNDLSYFIKTFKRITGITPNGMRKNAYLR